MPRKLKEKNKLQTFLDYFSNLDDPRVERNKLFPLDEIHCIEYASKFKIITWHAKI